MNSTAPWWLTVAVAFAGPLAGIAMNDRLTNRRDRTQARRADRERDRADRRRGYLALFEAADALEPAIADGRGESALEDVRRAASTAKFVAGAGIEPLVVALVEAGRRWIRAVATNAPSSPARTEAAEAFRTRLSEARDAMLADVAADQDSAK